MAKKTRKARKNKRGGRSYRSHTGTGGARKAHKIRKNKRSSCKQRGGSNSLVASKIHEAYPYMTKADVKSGVQEQVVMHANEYESGSWKRSRCCPCN